MKGRLLEMWLFEGGGLPSVWSLLRWSVIGVVSHQVFYQGGLSSGWSLIRVVSHRVVHRGSSCFLSGWSLISPYQGGLSSCLLSGWSVIRSYQGGLSSCLLSGWSVIMSFIRVVSHHVFIRVVSRCVFYQGGLSLGLIRVVFHQGGLSPGWFFSRVVFIRVVTSSRILLVLKYYILIQFFLAICPEL